METSVEELLLLIGEREFIKYKQQQEITRLNKQIEEMSQVITELRKDENVLEMKRG